MIVVKGTKKQRENARRDTLRPYKIVSRDNIKEFEGYEVDVLVIDELTTFKSISSARTKAILTIAATYKIGLTGTFLANGAIDIYAQAAACGLTFGGGLNFYAWRAMNFRDVLKGSGLAFEKWQLSTTLDKLLEPIRDNIFTLTAGDYLTIPPVTHNEHYIELDAKTRKAYDELDAFLGIDLSQNKF